MRREIGLQTAPTWDQYPRPLLLHVWSPLLMWIKRCQCLQSRVCAMPVLSGGRSAPLYSQSVEYVGLPYQRGGARLMPASVPIHHTFPTSIWYFVIIFQLHVADNIAGVLPTGRLAGYMCIFISAGLIFRRGCVLLQCLNVMLKPSRLAETSLAHQCQCFGSELNMPLGNSFLVP